MVDLALHIANDLSLQRRWAIARTAGLHLGTSTNLPFGEWTKVFPDPRLAKAVVDRLTHRAHIIETGTESWRFKHGIARGGRETEKAS